MDNMVIQVCEAAPSDGYYAGDKILFCFIFPATYPFATPEVRYVTISFFVPVQPIS